MVIEVYQDTVCPWCRIGKRHLQLALEGWEGEPVTVEYKPFFLDPTTPPEGRDFRSHMQAKFRGRASLEDLFETPTQRGAAVGLTFNFEAIQKAPNTLLSHRLIALTGYSETMIDAVYRAYFEDGQDIGDLETLVGLAAEQGFSAEIIRQQLTSDAMQEEVLAEVEAAQDLGITGVPFFIIDRRVAFSGAHPPALIRKALLQATSQ